MKIHENTTYISPRVRQERAHRGIDTAPVEKYLDILDLQLRDSAANTGAFRIESASPWPKNPPQRGIHVDADCISRLLIIAVHLIHNSVTRQLWYRFPVLSRRRRRNCGAWPWVGIIIIGCATTRSRTSRHFFRVRINVSRCGYVALMGHRGNDRKRAV